MIRRKFIALYILVAFVVLAVSAFVLLQNYPVFGKENAGSDWVNPISENPDTAVTKDGRFTTLSLPLNVDANDFVCREIPTNTSFHQTITTDSLSTRNGQELLFFISPEKFPANKLVWPYDSPENMIFVPMVFGAEGRAIYGGRFEKYSFNGESQAAIPVFYDFSTTLHLEVRFLENQIDIMIDDGLYLSIPKSVYGDSLGSTVNVAFRLGGVYQSASEELMSVTLSDTADYVHSGRIAAAIGTTISEDKTDLNKVTATGSAGVADIIRYRETLSVFESFKTEIVWDCTGSLDVLIAGNEFTAGDIAYPYASPSNTLWFRIRAGGDDGHTLYIAPGEVTYNGAVVTPVGETGVIAVGEKFAVEVSIDANGTTVTIDEKPFITVACLSDTENYQFGLRLDGFGLTVNYGKVSKVRSECSVQDKTVPYNGKPQSINFKYSEGIGLTDDDFSVVYKKDGVVTEPKNAGEYEVTVSCTNLNFNIPDATATLTIQKADLVVTAENKERYVGDENPAFTVKYAGFVEGETESNLGGTLAFECDANQSSEAGQYTIVPKGLTSENYNIIFVNGTLTVNELANIISAEDKTVTYNGKTQSIAFEYTLNSILSDEDFTVVYKKDGVVTEPKNAGVYDVTITCNDASINSNEVSCRLTVNKANLMVTANNASMVRGEKVPAFGVTYQGFVSGETKDVLQGTLQFECDVNSDSAAGDYQIIVSGLSSENYNIFYTNGVLTLSEKENAGCSSNVTPFTTLSLFTVLSLFAVVSLINLKKRSK